MCDVLVYDFETLNNKASQAVVVAFAAIACNWEDVSIGEYASMKQKAFYMTFKVKRQVEEYGLKTSDSTIDWWSKQSKEAQAVLRDPNKVEIDELPGAFAAYCKANGVNKNTTVLIRAPQFDATILENIYDKLGVDGFPYNFWKVRDTRSIIDTACGVDNGYVPMFKDAMERMGMTSHHAVDDCCKELLQVKMAIQGNYEEILSVLQ